MKRILPKLVYAALFSGFAISANAATTVSAGTVSVVNGPGDLDLNNIVLAANFDNGGNSHTVNGVTFQNDGSFAPGTFVGPRNVTPWQTTPNFGAGTDEVQLANIYADIRWALSNGEVLEAHLPTTAGLSYRLQILFYGNRNEARRWDIEIEGVMVVDEITSLGVSDGAGTPPAYSNSQGILYTYDFVAGDTTLDIIMGNLGGANDGGDRNPIWQGITLAQIPEPSTGLLALGSLALLLIRRRS